jgi:putative NADH-flavin reductase
MSDSPFPAPLTIAVFGATGGTGQAFSQQALAAGHHLRVLARTPSKLTAHPRLTVVEGNVLQADDVAQTITGADAVFCSLGNTANNPDMVVTEGTRHIIKAMQAQNVARLIVISSLGVGDSKDQVPFFFKALMKTVLKKAMADKEAQEALVKASQLEWVIIRPGGLTDEPASGEYQVSTGSNITAGRIARADVAAFALQQLTNNTSLGQTPAISA